MQKWDYCGRCAPTYFPTDSGFCWKCGAQCITCQYDDECTHEQYSVNSYDQCYSCRYGCDRCADAFACQVCLKGYYLEEDGCYPCPLGCNQCLANGVCLEKQTTPIEPNYSTAISTCAHGRYAVPYMGSQLCFVCQYGCDYCDSSHCMRCYEGFYMNSGFCNKCIYPCSTCSSMTQCLTYSSEKEDFESSQVWLYVLVSLIGVLLEYFGGRREERIQKWRSC